MKDEDFPRSQKLERKYSLAIATRRTVKNRPGFLVGFEQSYRKFYF